MNLHEQGSLFEKRLIDIATPGHHLYGKHMTRDQVNSYLLPPPQASTALADWLQNSGISYAQIRNDGHWITFTATVAQAEAILDTQYFYWTNGGRMQMRTLSYSVPDDLRSYISMIQPTTRFGQARPQLTSILGQGQVLVAKLFIRPTTQATATLSSLLLVSEACISSAISVLILTMGTS